MCVQDLKFNKSYLCTHVVREDLKFELKVEPFSTLQTLNVFWRHTEKIKGNNEMRRHALLWLFGMLRSAHTLRTAVLRCAIRDKQQDAHVSVTTSKHALKDSNESIK